MRLCVLYAHSGCWDIPLIPRRLSEGAEVAMTRTAKADRIQAEFLDALRASGGTIRTMAELASEATNPSVGRVFQSLGRAGRHVYLLKGCGLIAVHVRSEPPGWWNILKTVKEDLDYLRKELKISYYTVLLVGRKDDKVANGYIVTDFDKPPFVNRIGVEKTKFTINERQHLDSSKRIPSVHLVAQALSVMSK